MWSWRAFGKRHSTCIVERTREPHMYRYTVSLFLSFSRSLTLLLSRTQTYKRTRTYTSISPWIVNTRFYIPGVVDAIHRNVKRWTSNYASRGAPFHHRLFDSRGFSFLLSATARRSRPLEHDRKVTSVRKYDDWWRRLVRAVSDRSRLVLLSFCQFDWINGLL